jgi:hypothetical protein
MKDCVVSDGEERKAIWQWLSGSYMPTEIHATDDLM